MSVYLNMTCAMVSQRSMIGFPRGPSLVTEIPKSTAKITMGRRSPSYQWWAMFEGKRCRARSQPLCGAVGVTPEAVTVMSMGRPSPGRIQLATPRPMRSAMVVTTSK